mgnify:CR=1 FL=1
MVTCDNLCSTSGTALRKKVKFIENQQNKSYTVIDLYSLFVDNKGQLKNNLTYDGLHLNEQGYEVWSNFIKPITDSL